MDADMEQEITPRAASKRRAERTESLEQEKMRLDASIISTRKKLKVLRWGVLGTFAERTRIERKLSLGKIPRQYRPMENMKRHKD
jgi:hypothetical protein